MKVFLAGGTGAIGRVLVPRLVEGGHEVAVLARSPEKARAVETMGGVPVLADVLDAKALLAAAERTEPEVILHQLTALAGVGNFKKLDEEFALTNRLRAEVSIGKGGVSMMTEIRGGSNAKAKREFGWEPVYPSWRQGFFTGLG